MNKTIVASSMLFCGLALSLCGHAQDFAFDDAVEAWKRVINKLDRPCRMVERFHTTGPDGRLIETRQIVTRRNDNFVIEVLPTDKSEGEGNGQVYCENDRYLFELSRESRTANWVANVETVENASHLPHITKIFKHVYSRFPLVLEQEYDVMTPIVAGNYIIENHRAVTCPEGGELMEITFAAHPEADPDNPYANAYLSAITITFDPANHWLPIQWKQRHNGWDRIGQLSDFRTVRGLPIPFRKEVYSRLSDGAIVGRRETVIESFEFDNSIRPKDFSLVAFGLPEFGQVNNERPYRLEINWAFWLPILAGFVLIAAAVYRLRGGTSSSQTKTSQTRVARGFTLVELLVVIAIVGVLVGITLPAVQAVRSSARRTECLNNIRQISLGVLNYESSHRRFPVGIHAPDHDKFASLSWLAQILPYVEQAGMWQQTKSSYLSLPSPFWPHVNLQTPVPIYECPSIPTSGLPQWTHENKLVALTSYLGVNGTNYLSRDGIFYQQSRTRPADVADGLSNTLLIGERPPSADFWYGWWYAGHGQDGSGSPDMLLGVRETNDGAQFAESCEPGPYHFVAGELDEQCDLFHFWSVHPGGANFAMADGSVRWFAYTADEVMPALATRNGREVVQWPN